MTKAAHLQFDRGTTNYFDALTYANLNLSSITETPKVPYYQTSEFGIEGVIAAFILSYIMVHVVAYFFLKTEETK